jgi:hypothetical protein
MHVLRLHTESPRRHSTQFVGCVLRRATFPQGIFQRRSQSFSGGTAFRNWSDQMLPDIS